MLFGELSDAVEALQKDKIGQNGDKKWLKNTPVTDELFLKLKS